MRPRAATCRKKFNVSEGKKYFIFFRSKHLIQLFPETIKKFEMGEVFDDLILKCYMFCLFEEAEMVKDGKLYLVKFIDHIKHWDDASALIALNMGKRCMRPVGDNLCEQAFWVNKCLRESDPKVCILVVIDENHF